MSAESLTCQAWEALVLNVLQGRKTNHHQEPVSSKKTEKEKSRHDSGSDSHSVLSFGTELLPSIIGVILLLS